MGDLAELARLIGEKNQVALNIARLISRPAQVSHVGEYIASCVFGICLQESASYEAVDGCFSRGRLAGRSVNVKWYTKHEGVLDITPDALPDYYLVLAGPRSGAASSRGATRPWIIESVYLFEAKELVDALHQRDVKLGIATSVVRRFWEAAEIYPNRRSNPLRLSDEERKLLALFGPHLAAKV